MAYRITNVVWGLMFAYAALVQLNDPDPLRWVTIYAIAATFCALAVADHLPWRPTLGYAVCALVLAGFAWLGDSRESHLMSGFPYWGALREEIVREILGLLLISGWMTALGLWTRARSAPAAQGAGSN